MLKLNDLIEVPESKWRSASAKKGGGTYCDIYFFEASVKSCQATILDFCLRDENHKN